MNKKNLLEIIQKYKIEIIEDTMEINETGVDFRVVFAKDTKEMTGYCAFQGVLM